MGLFSKLMFWKKDDLDFDTLADKEMGKHDEMPQDDLGLDQHPSGLDEKPMFPEEKHDEMPLQPEKPAAPPYPTAPATGENKDLELISSKLDTLKALLNSLDQRMANLEQSAGVEKKQRLW